MDITPKEESILRSVATFYLLTCDQVTRLHYRPGSSRYVSALLKQMTERKLLHRLERGHVSLPYCYMLGVGGVRHLRSVGEELLPFYPSEHKKISSYHLAHWLSINEVLIAASKLPFVHEAITVVGIQHDWMLKKTSRDVIADALVHLSVHNRDLVIWLEVDRGTEMQKRVREKIHAILRVLQSQYATLFGSRPLVVAFATSAGTHRRTALLEWTQQELLATYDQEQGDWFRFTGIPEGEIDPASFFLQPVWSIPFRGGHAKLLEI